ncbi:MAG TPA: TatD family hydrolase, partial [Salinisphaeraceae bacterium]|nr:TatD family hydrolase [Salinisphaeraceae bacterium]
DIGANLAHDGFAADLPAVLERAHAAGVGRIVVTGSDEQSSRSALDLAAAAPGKLFATAGLHPHHAEDWSPQMAALMRTHAQQPGCRALGETGLDYFRNFADRRAQQQAFAAQLTIACDTRMPVFLHQRDAHADFLPILQEHLPDLPAAVVHCFTGTAAELDDYLALDLYIGITGWICDERRGQHLHDIVARIPDERLMIETDSPYLLPRTIRPRPKIRRNEPANLPYVLATLATARQQDRHELAAHTTANALRFFNLCAD